MTRLTSSVSLANATASRVRSWLRARWMMRPPGVSIRTLPVGAVPVPAPLPHVPVHVVQLKIVRPETADRGIIRGIYQLDGDRLKICLGEPGKGRPAKFETKPGSGHKLLELKRAKP